MKNYTPQNWIKNGDCIGIFKNDGCTNTEPPHTHGFIEIVYVLSGQAEEQINNECFSVSRGDILFINYGSTHAFTPIRDFSYYNIIFSPETVGHAVITEENALALLSLTAFEEMRALCDGSVLSFSGEERRETEAILCSMLREFENNLPASSKVIESYLNILITKMLRKTLLSTDDRAEKDIWQEISEYIDKNPGEALTLSSLAKKCFYNPSYFSRMFKQKFNISLTEYINRRRVDKAIELLGNSQLSVEEISSLVGFSDRSTFYNVFSRLTGSTPSEFRKSN